MDKFEEVKGKIHGGLGFYVKASKRLTTEEYQGELERITKEICQLFEPEHLGKAEFKAAFADELIDQMTGDEK